MIFQRIGLKYMTCIHPHTIFCAFGFSLGDVSTCALVCLFLCMSFCLSLCILTYTLTCASVFLVGLSECTCLCKSVYIPTQFLGTYHRPIPSILPTGLVVPFIPIFIHMPPYPAIYSLLGTFLRTAGATCW